MSFGCSGRAHSVVALTVPGTRCGTLHGRRLSPLLIRPFGMLTETISSIYLVHRGPVLRSERTLRGSRRIEREGFPESTPLPVNRRFPVFPVKFEDPLSTCQTHTLIVLLIVLSFQRCSRFTSTLNPVEKIYPHDQYIDIDID